MEQTSGFININKPPSWTSHDVVAKLRNTLGIKKIGHSGTLDPFATGVLVLGINEATRLFEYLPQDKVYIAEITFGTGTDSDDITGKVIETTGYIPAHEEITNALIFFKGKIKQKPPLYSAVHLNGKRAYKLARKEEITLGDIKEKDVEIYSISVESCHGMTLQLKIHCSGGTYIRSLARDLGKKLKTCAALSKLQRIKIGNDFTLEQSIALNKLTKDVFLEHLISPLSVIKLEKVSLKPGEIKDIFHGKSIKLEKNPENLTTKELQILDNNNNLVAIGVLTDDCIIKPKKVLVRSESYSYT